MALGHVLPFRAALNESIELAKTFAGEEAARFVNGVPGKLASTEAANNG